MEKSIGRRLRIVRIEKGMSQGDIEKRTGLLRSYLSRVENGHTIPSVGTLRKISAALGVSTAELLDSPENDSRATERFLGDKRQARFWNLMRKYVPAVAERDRRILLGLARRMAKKR